MIQHIIVAVIGICVIGYIVKKIISLFVSHKGKSSCNGCCGCSGSRKSCMEQPDDAEK